MTKTQKPGIAPIEPKLVRKVEEAVKSVAGLDPAKAMQVFLALAGEIDDEAGDQLVDNNPELIANMDLWLRRSISNTFLISRGQRKNS